MKKHKKTIYYIKARKNSNIDLLFKTLVKELANRGEGKLSKESFYTKSFVTQINDIIQKNSLLYNISGHTNCYLLSTGTMENKMPETRLVVYARQMNFNLQIVKNNIYKLYKLIIKKNKNESTKTSFIAV